ncbi:MAG: rhodanese-like domain-containing protein [Granulosicoccus sp.]
MIRSVIFLLALTICLIGRAASADIIEIDNVALEQLRAEGVAVIDVRRQDEWERTGMIPGSHPMTFFDAKGRYDAKAWLAQLDTIVKPDQPLVLICAHGVRSAKIAGLLDKRLGYSKVHNVTLGISEWLKERRPVDEFNP